MLINEFPKGFELNLRKWIHRNDWGRGSFFQIDLQVVGMMRGQLHRLGFIKDIRIVMILFRDEGEIGSFVGDGSRFGREGGVRKVNSKGLFGSPECYQSACQIISLMADSESKPEFPGILATRS